LSPRNDTEAPVSSLRTERSVSSFSAAARVGGLVVALGYLTGAVNGPLVAAVGGLALITLGRSLRMDRSGRALSAAGFAVFAGALGIAAIRWGTLELAELRSVQAVLGPTILVGPEAAAIAAILATAAASVALGLWVTAGPVRGLLHWTWTVLETLAVALALVTAFWGPKILVGSVDVPQGEVLESFGVWAAAVSGVTFASVAGGLLARILPVSVRTGLMILALVALTIAAALIGSVL
jgi:hypothetical protein